MILAFYDVPILFSDLEEYTSYTSFHPELDIPSVCLVKDLVITGSAMEEVVLYRFEKEKSEISCKSLKVDFDDSELSFD